MAPTVILDTNALQGRKPLNNANSKLLLALSMSGQIALVVPEVVLQELSRQWAEEAEDHAAKLNTAVKSLNEILEELEAQPTPLRLPPLDRQRFYEHARQKLAGKNVDLPAPPEVSIKHLLNKDLNCSKPFNREGKGFRDALIWETIRAAYDSKPATPDPMIFVTNNHTDFCDKKGGRLHPDLRADLSENREIEVLPSIYELFKHPVIHPLVESHRSIESQLGPDRLEELIDIPVADLHGRDVEELVGVYVGSGMIEVPVTTGLEGATFDEIMPDLESIAYDIFSDGEESTVRVTFEADCSFDGFLDKTEYYMDEEANHYTLFEDWNDHMFRVGTSGRVRFIFSGTVVGTNLDGLALTLDEAESLDY